MTRRLRAIFGSGVLALLWLALAGLAAAHAGDAKPLKGVALVIGNGAYEHIARLDNPTNDAHAIDGLLRGLGFDTTVVSDRNAKRLKRDLDGFVDDAEGADVAVIYYSGHGIEAGGENFLVPTDADVASLEDAGDRLVPLSDIVARLQKSVPVTIVMLDACRSDPFPPGSVVRKDPDTAAAPVGSGGLGEARGAVALTASAASDRTLGTVIGFAAEPGHVALDGPPGTNSPYAAAILRHLSAMDGAEFGAVMRMVAEEVYLKTNGKQRPWVNESLRRLLYFGNPPAGPAGEEGSILKERRALLLSIADLSQASRREIETIATASDVPMDGLYAMLSALGVARPQDPAELDRLLKEQAGRLKTMLAERDALKSDDPEIRRLSGLADQAIGEGALKAAVDILGQAKARVAALSKSVDEVEADLRRKRIEFAAVFARSAQARILAFDFAGGADDYRQAYEQLQRWDDDLAWTYLAGEADTLLMQGQAHGDRPALDRGIASATEAARRAEAFPDADRWIRSTVLLGNMLQALGEYEDGTDSLNKSVPAFQAALGRIDRQKDPASWARTSNELANTLARLGERTGNAAVLKQATAIYTQVADYFETADARPEWALAQNNLGKALLDLSNIEPDSATLQRGIEAFQDALDETDAASAPYLWAGLLNNLGNGYSALARQQAGGSAAAGYLAQALEAYRNAALVWTRERVPMQWALLQSNMANAYERLGAGEADAEKAAADLQRAEAAARGTLEVVTRERAPVQWAVAGGNLARILYDRANREAQAEAKAALLAEASGLLSQGLSALSRERTPTLWAGLQNQLGNLAQAQSEIRTDGRQAAQDLKVSAAALTAALGVYGPAGMRRERAEAQHDLGMALMLLGPLENDPRYYAQAESVYRDEQGLRDRAADPVAWARAQAGIGNALRGLGLARRDKATLVEARRVTQEAWDTIRPLDRQYDGVLEGRIKEIDAALAALE